MRLRRLDLARYGKFTGHSIDFGAAEPGRPDLHIVYGPNEAGKSTTLAAYLDLLFRIEVQTNYAFLHPGPTMRIGGALEAGGTVHELVRIKRNQNDLLDAADRPVNQGLIAGMLGGIDRAAYRAMFSLDDETLEAGGESILESKGELGQLLFSASAGLAELSHRLVGLREDADRFHRRAGRDTGLRELKRTLDELEAQRREKDTFANAYAQLVAARDTARRQYEEALAARTATATRIDDVQRYLHAMPRLAAFRAASEQLAPLAELPEAPEGWTELLGKLGTEATELATEGTVLDGQIESLTKELHAVPADTAALAQADRVARLNDMQSPVVLLRDMAERGRDLSVQEADIAGLLVRLGRQGEAAPECLLLDAGITGTLRDLIGKRSGIDTALVNGWKARREARAMLVQALAAVEGNAALPTEAALRALTDVLDWLETDDHAIRLRAAAGDAAACEATLRDQLAALRPWQGDIDALARAAIPEREDWEQLQVDLGSARERHRQAANDVAAARAAVDTKADACRALTAVLGIVGESEAAAIRARRDAAWRAHRGILDGATADAFEMAMQADDGATAGRLAHASDAARLREAALALALAEAAAVRAEQRAQADAEALRDRQRAIDAVIAPLLPAGTTPAQMEAWLRKRQDALDTAARLKAAAQALGEARTDAEAATQRLRAVLQAAGAVAEDGMAVDALRRLGREAVVRATELRNRRSAIEACAATAARRRADVSGAIKAARDWQAAWRAACGQCWLGPEQSVAVVAEVLEVLPELRTALRQRASLRERLEGMRAALAAFGAEVAGIARAIGMDGDREGLVDAVKHRVAAAKAAEGRRDGLAGQLAAARGKRAAVDAALCAHGDQVSLVTGHFGVGTLAEAAACLAGVRARAVLRQQAGAAEAELLDGLRVTSVDAAEAALAGTDRAALEGELAGLQARLPDQDQRLRELFAQQDAAAGRVDAVGGDGAVARIEEQRRTVQLEIEDGAMRYLRLRAGIAATEHALRAYRQQHQSAMMAAASEAFRMITRGAYAGLSAQPGKDRDILIAVAADGSSKPADGLSKGARFQLYLALRVAGYQEFARTRGPVPFIADDIMETFDDERAEETLRVLTGMAGTGQVIYLTHHRHLCGIAERVCPGVGVIELAQGGGGG
jgi:hypothetical protein